MLFNDKLQEMSEWNRAVLFDETSNVLGTKNCNPSIEELKYSNQILDGQLQRTREDIRGRVRVSGCSLRDHSLSPASALRSTTGPGHERGDLSCNGCVIRVETQTVFGCSC